MQFLFLAQLVDGTPEDRVAPLLKDEARRAWELYAAGLIRSLHSRADIRGVVGLLEGADLTEVTKAVESLPLVQAGVLKTEIIPLKLYVGFERLFTP